jgi:hypothetical protein
LKPEREKVAEALPLLTVPETTGTPFTTNVTVPLLTAGPVAGATVACSDTDAAPNVADALDAVVVVAIAEAPTASVPLPSEKSPAEPAPAFVARTVNDVDPAGVAAVVVIVKVDVIDVLPFEKGTVAGLNDAVAPDGSPAVT